MGLKCKQGEMAYDLGPFNTDYYGRICTVDKFIGDALDANGRQCLDAWEISFGDETHDPRDGLKWMERDCYLLPIRPDDLKETEETDKEIAACGL